MFEHSLDPSAFGRVVVISVVGFISCYFLYRVFLRIRDAYFTQLYHIPCPWYARFTSRRLKYAILMGRRVHYVHALHQKYGPIVRIAPNESAISDPAASKEIHSVASRLLKVHVDIGPVPNIFSMTDPKQHNIRRRLYNKGLSQASLRTHWGPLVRNVVQIAVSKIKQDAHKDTADIFKWWMLMSNDIICLFTIGEGFGMLEKGEKDYHILTAVELHLGLAINQFSSLMNYLGRMLSPISPELDKVFSIGKRLYGYGTLAVKSVRAKNDAGAHRTFFSRAAEDAKADKARGAKGGEDLTDAEIAIDAAGFQLAGSDTVAIALTFLLWCVLDRPTLRKELEQEVAGISGDITDGACEKLPLLNAVIDETLRLHGAAPTALRRVVPTGGTTLCGYRIPDTAIVATQAYSLHKNPEVWKDPDTFDPSRWLPGGPQRASKGTDTFMPFGAGTRSCAGIYLARMELRIAAATFFRECPGARLAPSATAESMVVVDRFNTHPVARRCDITLMNSES